MGKKMLSTAEAAERNAQRDDDVLLRTQRFSANLPELSGFEDESTRRLVLANRALRKSRMATLKPILPLMLNLKGRPYRLHDYFPFEPFFRTRVPRNVLLKTGRQVSKSTSLAAQGVVFSNSIPHFSTLYVTPLFEMVRRFSHQYVRKFIEDSPVRRLISGTNTVNSVLQRSFTNGASMYFSYAFLDAERTRGIPADKNCLVSGTPVELTDGAFLPIERVPVGTDVVSADKNGILVSDTVTDRIYQGVRDVYEVWFDDGSRVQCTADERFLRDDGGGWVALSEIAEAATRERPVDAVPVPDAPRVFARGLRDHQNEPDGGVPDQVPPRRPTGGVLPPQGRPTGGLRRDTATASTQSRLGGNNGCVHDHHKCRVRADRQTGGSVRRERGDGRMGHGTGLGGRRLLGDGRRWKTAEPAPLQHPRLLQARGGEVGHEASRHGRGRGRRGAGVGPRSCLLQDRRFGGRFPLSVATGAALGSPVTGVQVAAGAPGRDVQRLRGDVPRASGSGRGPSARLRTQALRSGPTQNAVGGEFHRGTAATEERTTAGPLPGNRCRSAQPTWVRYVGPRPVWDLNTKNHHAFFAAGVLVHNCIDEVQDINYDFIQIIHETLGASRWKLIQYAGTPKSLDNTMEKLWQDSSQAEWMIKCHQAGCGAWNVPSLEHDLLDMIGPWSRDIGPDRAGIICVECAKPLDPRRFGRWVHRHRERRWQFAGYHVPQMVMPMHYADHEAWDFLTGKLAGRRGTTTTTFFNEVCGESCDVGAKLLTETDLKRACTLPWKNDWKVAIPLVKKRRYRHKVLAADWGGGGGRVPGSRNDGDAKRLRTSFTTLAALGITHAGKIDCLWGYRSLRSHDMNWEAQLCVDAVSRFGLSHIVHDYGGAGAGREYPLVYAGFPLARLIPIKYEPTARASLMHFHRADENHPRDFYVLDKARSLVLTCQAIKFGQINFFEYDYRSADEPGLLRDFMALQEEKVDSRMGTDTYVITRNPNMPDDFAQAVNYGACALWNMTDSWPDLAVAAKFEIPDEVLAQLHPRQKVDWDLL